MHDDDDNARGYYVNRYYCPDCKISWSDTWSCGCEDECSGCGKDYTPKSSVFRLYHPRVRKSRAVRVA